MAAMAARIFDISINFFGESSVTRDHPTLQA